MSNSFDLAAKNIPLNTTAAIPDGLSVPQRDGLFQGGFMTVMIWLLVAAFVVFFVVLPMYRKMKRKQLKVKETSEIKKDLMIWRHLSDLVRGGEEHQKAKRMLSDKIEQIQFLFRQGLDLLAMHSRKLYELPWFVLIGEPRSGKSSLLRNSELEILCASEEEIPDDGTDKKDLPLRLWLGAKAVICDIGGKTFFDRWLNGSSAEWNYITKLLRHKRFKKPLDGIIITIPADALIADKETLTQQKAMLMTTELGQLLTTEGMHLPCYVVVTKLDMVNGFREYVMGMSDDIRSQIFGWTNTEKSAHYSENKFKEFWTSLIERLHAGCEKSMLSKNVAAKLSALSNRMEITGKIYLFPENFNALYQNLSIYLRVLFGEGNFHGADNAVLEGVFFTSAKDGNVSLSPSFAALCEKPIDECPVSGTAQQNERPYFIRDLLHKIIFKFSPNAVFTRAEQIRRHIPLYTLCAAMCFLGVLWLSTAFIKADGLQKSLYSATDYYKSLNTVLKNNIAFNSPLVKKNEDGKYVLNSDSLSGEKGSSRLQFFFEVFSQRETHVIAPFGFKLASFVVFGRQPDMGYDDKAFITNQLFGIQLRTPVLKSVGDKLLTVGASDGLTKTKREAIRNFSLLDDVKNEDFTELFTSDQFDFKPVMNYLLPSLSDDTMALLNCFDPKYDRKHTMTMDPAYIHSETFFKAQRTALESILKSWREKDAYPDETYPKIKETLLMAKEIAETDRKLSETAAKIAQVDSVKQLGDTVSDWNSMIKEQSDAIEKMKRLLSEIDYTRSLSKKADIRNIDKKAPRNFIRSDLSGELFLRIAYKNYKKRFAEDFAFVKDQMSSYNGEESWGNLKEKSALNDLKRDIEKKLSAEAESLEKDISKLSEDPLFQWKFFETGIQSDYMFLIANNIGRYSAAIADSDRSVLEGNDFKTNWTISQSRIKDALEKFDTYSKPLAEDQDFAQRVATYRKMLLAQADLNRFIVLDDALKKLPDDKSEMGSFVENKAQNNTVFNVSPELWKEAAVDLSYSKSYDPTAVKNLLEDILIVARPFLKNKKSIENQQILPSFVEQYKLYDASLATFEKYLIEYINYWGHYPSTAYEPAKTWAEFRERAKMTKSYKVNSLLQLVYAKSISILKNTDNTLLSEDVVKQKTDLIAMLNDRLNLLTTFFSEAGTKTLNAWATLPEDSKTAWEKLQSTSEQELKNSFMAAHSGNKHSDIPWWNDFIDNGIELLKTDDNRRVLTAFKNTFEETKAFPLCANCTNKAAISPKKLRETAKLLASMGAGMKTDSVNEAEKDQKNEASEKEHLNKKTSLFKDSNTQKWADGLYRLADLLSNEKKPLSWSIAQPSVETQNMLPSKKMPAAVNRFRYIEVSTPTGRNAMRFNTSLGKKTTIAQGNVVDSNLTLKFYKLSGDTTPEAKVTFKDFWSVLKLYLSPNTVYDPDSKLTYIPVTVKDSAGVSYIYYITLSFSKELPPALDWPRRKDWPKFKAEDYTLPAPETTEPTMETATNETSAPPALF